MPHDTECWESTVTGWFPTKGTVMQKYAFVMTSLCCAEQNLLLTIGLTQYSTQLKSQ